MTPENFWNEDDMRRDQKFYVAFCLLESALGNYAVARDLHVHNKFNWASTVYYYSLVHALRLVCFIPMGDFPTDHAGLAKLYKGDTPPSKKAWMPKFQRNFESGTQIEQISFTREHIAKYFDANGHADSITDEKFKKWGNILDKARECRNNSNYEGLIIAHEYMHTSITGQFNKLANLFQKACEKILPEVISLFKVFLDKSSRKKYWYSYLNYKEKIEGLYYLENSLKYRLLGEGAVMNTNSHNRNTNAIFDTQKSNAIINDILEFLKPLRMESTDSTFAKEVMDNISSGIFSEKKSLMNEFTMQIDKLKKIVDEEQRNDP